MLWFHNAIFLHRKLRIIEGFELTRDLYTLSTLPSTSYHRFNASLPFFWIVLQLPLNTVPYYNLKCIHNIYKFCSQINGAKKPVRMCQQNSSKRIRMWSVLESIQLIRIGLPSKELLMHCKLFIVFIPNYKCVLLRKKFFFRKSIKLRSSGPQFSFRLHKVNLG